MLADFTVQRQQTARLAAVDVGPPAPQARHEAQALEGTQVLIAIHM